MVGKDLIMATLFGSGGGGSGGGLDALIDGSITEVSSKAEKVREYAFYKCDVLVTANFTAATMIEGNAFYTCASLTNVNLPNVESLGLSAFSSCYGLKKLDLPKVTSIPRNCFSYSSAFATLVLRNETAVSLVSTNAFTSTKIASGNGYIYVPAALVDTYKAATNWSTYTDQFRALEDYTVDGTITGELDESKI